MQRILSKSEFMPLAKAAFEDLTGYSVGFVVSRSDEIAGHIGKEVSSANANWVTAAVSDLTSLI